MTIGIYGFFDFITDECLYVGQSIDIEQRHKQHLVLLKSGRHRRKEFVDWWIKRGETEKSFRFSILEECNKNSLNEQEMYWFNHLSPCFYGHKPTLNGKWEKTKETKDRISKSSSKRMEAIFSNLYSDIDRVVLISKDNSVGMKEAAVALGVSTYSLKRFLSVNEISFITSSKSKLFSDEEVSLCNRLAENPKISKAKAADILNMSRKRLSILLKEYSIEFISPYVKLHSRDSEILDLFFDEEMSTREIANHFGCSQPNIIYVLNKHRSNDIRFSEVSERMVRKPRKISQDEIKRRKKALRNNQVTCKHCGLEVIANAIKRHEKSCDTWPKCSVCGKRLSARKSVKCKQHAWST